MATEWMKLVKKTLSENPGLAFKQVLKLAKKAYKGGSSSGSTKKTRRRKPRSKGTRRKGRSARRGKSRRARH